MKRAFTLIELLVVIAIIGILASVVVVNVGSSRGKARYGKMVSDLKSLETSIQLYYDDTGTYPADDSLYTGLLSKYVPSWPAPPCQGWFYDYQQWGDYISIWVRSGNYPVTAATFPFTYPIANASLYPTAPQDIRNISSKTITCNEI